MYSKVGRSKSGLPTITEEGGGASNTGSAIVVCGPQGERVKPLFVPKGYAQGTHAIFVAKVGMYILEGSHSKGNEEVVAYCIELIGKIDQPDFLVLRRVGEYANGDSNLPDFLDVAVDAALAKSRCYHCREPHYILREE